MIYALTWIGAILLCALFLICFIAILSLAVGEDPREVWREFFTGR